MRYADRQLEFRLFVYLYLKSIVICRKKIKLTPEMNCQAKVHCIETLYLTICQQYCMDREAIAFSTITNKSKLI